MIELVLAILIGLYIGGRATRLKRLTNKDRQWNEAKVYYRINNPFNAQIEMLFTESEIKEARKRAARNPEDLA
jgi:hypothetical protein